MAKAEENNILDEVTQSDYKYGFVTDIETSRRLRTRIPADKIVVAESGIRGRKDIESLMLAGIHTFLIGEHLVIAPDMGVKLRAFIGED